jgi:DMSO/TMAO reductase YedYZ molybdopterin-dependent catalytic subunit
VADFNEEYVKGKEKVAHLFQARERGHGQRGANRLPPGQRLVESFPILDLGVRPSEKDIPTWKLIVDGAVEVPTTWTVDALKSLPNHEQIKDFHCVTRWSTYDHQWKGVLLRDIAALVKPTDTARILVFHSFDGYSTNVPIEEALTDEGMVAWELDDDDLPIIHGGPIRGLIPQLYGWKSAKFLQRIEFLEEDDPGFWELRGYHNHGDPWEEERYGD